MPVRWRHTPQKVLAHVRAMRAGCFCHVWACAASLGNKCCPACCQSHCCKGVTAASGRCRLLSPYRICVAPLWMTSGVFRPCHQIHSGNVFCGVGGVQAAFASICASSGSLARSHCCKRFCDSQGGMLMCRLLLPCGRKMMFFLARRLMCSVTALPDSQ